MPSTRRAILASLKRNGALRSRDLVDELGITVTAVRQQLDRLQEDGLVVHRQQPTGRGRPSHIYQLAPAAEEFFPKRYGDLTNELLGYLGGPDSDDVAELFERRRQRRLRDAKTRLADLSLDGKVRELARILDEDGYLADVEETGDGGWRIVEHNCAILSVASGFRQACTSEIRFIGDALPEANVARVAHILNGAHVCAYEVHRRDG
ncbi:MAG TPA: winged helix-turn-helix transcriptional regulator [Acidimicrobiales bacterium]|nr:winged helix-turn-helix transcriptional regulator [Acidimicrobiales bacterium]